MFSAESPAVLEIVTSYLEENDYQKCRKTPFFRYGDIRRIGVSRYAYTAARGIL